MRVATRLAAKPAPPLELQGPAPIFPGLMSSAPRFGNGQALHKHEPKVMSPRADWSGPPAPGHYDVGQNKDPKFPSPRASSFGGNLSKEDRSKTGLHGIAMKGRNLPGPNSYSVDEYVKTKSRVPTFKFGASSRGASNGSAISPPPPVPRVWCLLPGHWNRGAFHVQLSLLSEPCLLLPRRAPSHAPPLVVHIARQSLRSARRRHRRPHLHEQGAHEAELLALTTLTHTHMPLSSRSAPDNAHSHPHALWLAPRAFRRRIPTSPATTSSRRHVPSIRRAQLREKGGGGQACAAAGERERGKVRGPSTSARCSCVRL